MAASPSGIAETIKADCRHCCRYFSAVISRHCGAEGSNAAANPCLGEYQGTIRFFLYPLCWGSEDKGQQLGGDGAIRVLEFRELMAVSLLSQSRKIPLFGRAGGECGALGENQWLKLGQLPHPLAGIALINVQASDHLRICTPSGSFGVVRTSN